MQVDYIIVGFGLAGMAMANEMEKHAKSFVVFDHNPNRPGRIIGGMYNPIILKRFTPAWKAHEMWQESKEVYKDLEKIFQKKYIFPIEVRRILQSTEEQNNWVVASDKAIMSQYMQTDIVHENIPGIKADFGFGILHNVGRVKGEILLEDYKKKLMAKGIFRNETFRYHELVFDENRVAYKDLQARHLIFSEGSYLPNNPFFDYLPMREAKGELLEIAVPGLQIDFTIKSGVFMIPYSDNTYMVGATYNWEDKSFEPTEKGKKELENKLQKFLERPYSIVRRKVGIRPTVKDRRPLLGRHPKYPNLSILNGLGTRGIILAPALAKELYDHLEKGQDIINEMHINRFESLL